PSSVGLTRLRATDPAFRERSVLMRRLILRSTHILLPLLTAAISLALVVPASATVSHFRAPINGASESPPNASTGVGNVEITMDDVAHTMRVQAVFSGLVGNTTASHIHTPTAVPFTSTVGVVTTMAGFPLGVKSGTYDHTFDMTLASSYSAAY